MALKTTLTRADILPMADFEALRKQKRSEIVAMKKNRRVALGPYATFYFENYTTMWWQVHEMLRIEKGGEGQIADEIAAYAPLIPQGRELVCTFMIEIDEPVRRQRMLAQLGGIDEQLFLEIGAEKIFSVPEQDAERTREDGKTSSVHFLRFPLSDAAVKAFREPGARIMLGCAHENYGHLAVLSETTRAALAEDFA